MSNAMLALVFAAAFLISFNIVNNIFAIRHPLQHTDVRGFALDVDVPPAPPAPPMTEAEFLSRYGEKGATEQPRKAGAAGSTAVATTAGAGSGEVQMDCNKEDNAEYWGEVVQWGDTHLVGSWEACCAACTAHKPEPGKKKCNTWVYCPNPKGCAKSPHKSCWLKWQAKPNAPAVTRGPEVQWMSGGLYSKVLYDGEPGVHKKYHTVLTANAAKYVQWQSRVMYYWFKKRRAEQGPDGQMGGFTRVLHEGRGDELMDEIPTCVVDRLSQEFGFVVLSRPNAIVQMLQKCKIEEEYILMAEPDHLILKPIPNLMNGNKPAAFPFFYINPKDHKELVRKYVEPLTGPLSDGDIEAMDPIGNSPNFITKSDLTKIAPIWADFSLRMKQDPECDKAWGWVLEMYAYTCAARAVGVSHDLHPRLAAQPPWDTQLRDFLILHYTYGNDYTLDGVFTPGKIGQWRFDKRSYMAASPPRNLSMPPKGVPETVVMLISMINEATANIPNWD